MKRTFGGLLGVVLFLVGCGSSPVDPVLYGAPIADGVVTVEPGSFVFYPFTVDPAQMIEPAVVGALTVTGGGTGTVSLLVLSADNFELWKNGGTYASVFASDQIPGGNFEIPIPAAGSYQLIFSNAADLTAQKSVDVIASLYFLIYPK